MHRTSFISLLLLSFAASAFNQSASPKPKRQPLPTSPPDSVQAELDITYGKTPEQELKLDIYRPKQLPEGKSLPACVLIHGGGWVKGTKEAFRPLAFALAEKGYVVANIEYRLGPVAKYPAAVQDCSLAVRFLRANAKRYGADPNRIATWGGSAGGHLAALVAAAPTHPTFVPAELKDVPGTVQACCVMAGPTNLLDDRMLESLRKGGEKSYAFQWLGKLPDEAMDLYREASPITHFTKATGPMLFLTGDLDNPARDASALEKLKELGVTTRQVVLKDAKHGCWNQMPWHTLCVDAVDAWFKEHLK